MWDSGLVFLALSTLISLSLTEFVWLLDGATGLDHHFCVAHPGVYAVERAGRQERGFNGYSKLDVGYRRAYVFALLVHRLRQSSGIYKRILRSGAGGFGHCKRSSYGGRLDERGFIHLDGRPDFFYGVRWIRLSPRMDGGLCAAGPVTRPLSAKIRAIHRPDFVATRFYSKGARIVAAVAAIFVSFTYVAGQMTGVGVAFSRFLEVPLELGVVIGMCIVAFFAVLGGMKGITYTQVAQYCVLIFAYTVPAIAIALLLTNNPIPQVAMGDILPKLNAIQTDLGLSAYSSPFANLSMLNVCCIALCLMAGTAGLPHVIVRFYTVKSVKAARWSAFWALLFIAILYTTAPALAMFAKYYILEQYNTLGADFQNLEWVQSWAATGLITFPEGGPTSAESLLGGINRDIIVLATPEIAGLPAFVVALVAAGGLAAALSTASGLLLVISSSLAHDIYGSILRPQASDKQKLFVGRMMIFLAVLLAGILGIYPLGFVAEVVAFAFGLAAASFFPIIVLGIFWKRANKQGAIAGMSLGSALRSS